MDKQEAFIREFGTISMAHASFTSNHGNLSHLNSTDSERSPFESEIEGTTTLRNEKKSKFFRSFPTDIHGPNDFGEKNQKRKSRRYTILEEQKLTQFLFPHDSLRRKSAEGSIFGISNKKIAYLDQFAPFHPNYQEPAHLHQSSAAETKLKSQLTYEQQKIFKRQSQVLQDGNIQKQTTVNLERTATLQLQSQFSSQRNGNTTTNGGLVSQISQNITEQNEDIRPKQKTLLIFNNQSQSNYFNETSSQPQPKNLKNLLQVKPKQFKISTNKRTITQSDTFNNGPSSSQQITSRNEHSSQTANTFSHQQLLNSSLSNSQQREDSFSSFLNPSNQLLVKLKQSDNHTISKYVIGSSNANTPSTVNFGLKSQNTHKSTTALNIKTSETLFSPTGSSSKSSNLISFSKRVARVNSCHKLTPISPRDSLKKQSKHSQQLFSDIYIANNPLYMKKQTAKKQCHLLESISPKNEDLANKKEQLSSKLSPTPNNTTKGYSFSQLSSHHLGYISQSNKNPKKSPAAFS